MRDPLLIIEPIPPSEYYESKPQPPGGWPARTQPSVKSENKLHSNVRNLVQEKDRLIEQGNFHARELAKERRWRKILSSALVATWATLIYILKLLVPYALKGMLAK